MRSLFCLFLTFSLLSSSQAQSLDAMLNDILTKVTRLDILAARLSTRIGAIEASIAKEFAAFKTTLNNLSAQEAHEAAAVKLRVTQLTTDVQAATAQLSSVRSCCEASAKERASQIANVISAVQSVKPTMSPVGPGVSSGKPEGCLSLLLSGYSTPGVYNIRSSQLGVAQVWCEAGYTTILRRSSGKESFDRTMADYISGFGSAANDHWQGLELQHHLTSAGPVELVIEFYIDKDSTWNQKHFFGRYPADNDGKLKYVRAAAFAVGAASEYKLTLQQLDSNLVYNLTTTTISRINGKDFSAKNMDRDGIDRQNCASRYGGGFWDPCSWYLAPTVTKAHAAGYKCSLLNKVCVRIYPYMAQSVHMKIRV